MDWLRSRLTAVLIYVIVAHLQKLSIHGTGDADQPCQIEKDASSWFGLLTILASPRYSLDSIARSLNRNHTNCYANALFIVDIDAQRNAYPLNVPYYLPSVLVDDHHEDKLPLIHNVHASKDVIDNDSVLAIDQCGKWEVASVVEHREMKNMWKHVRTRQVHAIHVIIPVMNAIKPKQLLSVHSHFSMSF